jgi:hypothetical protein
MVFDHDEDGYRRWLLTNPNGFVVNCGRPARASYIVLHRVSCTTINGVPARGDTWTIAYRKVCSPARAELDGWARQEAGSSPSPCGLCHP